MTKSWIVLSTPKKLLASLKKPQLHKVYFNWRRAVVFSMWFRNKAAWKSPAESKTQKTTWSIEYLPNGQIVTVVFCPQILQGLVASMRRVRSEYKGSGTLMLVTRQRTCLQSHYDTPNTIRKSNLPAWHLYGTVWLLAIPATEISVQRFFFDDAETIKAAAAEDSTGWVASRLNPF